MSNLKRILEEILKMPYESNSYSKHEELVGKYLDKGGFKKIDLKKFKEEGLQPGEYVHQPYGSQRHPDFLLKEGDRLFSIECKTSKQSCPVYNGGIPKEDTIYIFSSGKYNKTTIFLGRDILSEQKRNSFEELIIKLKNVVKEHQEDPEWPDERGFDFYIRNMYTQSGGQEKTDYFNHKDRQKCEQGVLEYVSRV